MRDAALAHSVLVEPGSAFGISSREPHSCSASILGTHPVGVSARLLRRPLPSRNRRLAPTLPLSSSRRPEARNRPRRFPLVQLSRRPKEPGTLLFLIRSLILATPIRMAC